MKRQKQPKLNQLMSQPCQVKIVCIWTPQVVTSRVLTFICSKDQSMSRVARVINRPKAMHSPSLRSVLAAAFHIPLRPILVPGLPRSVRHVLLRPTPVAKGTSSSSFSTCIVQMAKKSQRIRPDPRISRSFFLTLPPFSLSFPLLERNRSQRVKSPNGLPLFFLRPEKTKARKEIKKGVYKLKDLSSSSNDPVSPLPSHHVDAPTAQILPHASSPALDHPPRLAAPPAPGEAGATNRVGTAVQRHGGRV